MVTFVIVLAFPAILFVAYGIAYVLLRRKREALEGALGFGLYCALLLVPAVAVSGRPGLLAGCFAFSAWSPAWVAAGVAVAVALYAVQRLLARRVPEEPRVWVGPPGRWGFALLMLPVAYVVVAEEVVWRGYLTPEIGVPLASAAFALHHYHFGWRHVIFSFGAGLLWGALFRLEGGLYTPIASHLTYNALAWAWMRRPRKTA
jgi:membrane protease YdiL (CAAX protease family)